MEIEYGFYRCDWRKGGQEMVEASSLQYVDKCLVFTRGQRVVLVKRVAEAVEIRLLELGEHLNAS